MLIRGIVQFQPVVIHIKKRHIYLISYFSIMILLYFVGFVILQKKIIN